MISSISAGSLNLASTAYSKFSTSVDNQSDDTKTVKVSRRITEQLEKDTKTTDDDVTAVSSQGDTLTLSTEGQSALKAAASAPSGSAPSGSAPAGAAPAGGQGVSSLLTEDDEDDDDSSSSQDLSAYTASDLRQMLASGEITQAEYAREMASREADSQASQQMTMAKENLSALDALTSEE